MDTAGMDRRQLLRTAGKATVAAAAATPALLALTGESAGASLLTGPGAGPYMRDMGTGMYWDLSTASQLSTFSIQPTLVTCGVGTVGLLGLSGPFAMMMYSVRINSYTVDRGARTLTASGRMRSITIVAMAVQENVEHDFIAVAVDNRGVGPDRFDVHFTTPFWAPPNPLATPSTLRPGWSRFGGGVAGVGSTPLGGVTVSDS